MSFFVFNWRQHAVVRVLAVWIVKHLDIVKHVLPWQEAISKIETGSSGTKLETIFDLMAALDLEITVRSAAREHQMTSYLPLLMTSGLKQWSNPSIDRITKSSDFDFGDIRKTPFSVDLVVEPLMVKPLAPLIRLFFSDLLASLQDHEPGTDEP